MSNNITSLVSIIVPIYNEYEFIDRCMKSIVNQIYKNLEIILINDGSTDQSEMKCKAWMERDSRIVYISKKNEGQGVARNLGIKKATGEYIAFLDADDWWEEDTIYKAYNKINQKNGDIVLFDRYLVTSVSNTGEFFCTLSRQPLIIDDVTNANERPELIYRSNGVLWDKMYKRSLFIDYHIEQPSHLAEDISVLPMLLARAKRVCQVREPLYYYWLIPKKRDATFVKRSYQYRCCFECIKFIRDSFVKNDMFMMYEDQLRKFSNFHFRIVRDFIIKEDLSRKDKMEKYSAIFNEAEVVMSETYGDFQKVNQVKFIVWGSYNLRSMINRMLFDLNNLKEHFCFCSISSLMMMKKDIPLIVRHANEFRKEMLLKDINKEFTNLSIDTCKNTYLCIDFLEERFAAIEGDFGFATKSDAFDESNLSSEKYKLVCHTPVMTMELWKSKCLEWIDFIKGRFSLSRIILVENYLAEHYGYYGKENEFENINEIKAFNDRLKDYYKFFKDHCVGINVISLEDENIIFSDIDFDHGCYPYHLNEYCYYEIADKIEHIVMDSLKCK